MQRVLVAKMLQLEVNLVFMMNFMKHSITTLTAKAENDSRLLVRADVWCVEEVQQEPVPAN